MRGLASDEEVVVGEELHVGDLASAEVDEAVLEVGLGTDELEDVDFAVFPAVAVEFLLALEEVALEFLEFDGLLVFVELACRAMSALRPRVQLRVTPICCSSRPSRL